MQGFLHLGMLAVDVAGIFGDDFDLFDNGSITLDSIRRQRLGIGKLARLQAHQRGVVHIRSAQQFQQVVFMLQSFTKNPLSFCC